MESLEQVPKIRILASDTSKQGVYPIAEGRITIGRSEENTIVLQDSLVSRHHAELQFDGEAVLLKDLGGKNPIRVNGAEVQDYQLFHGDRIQIGHTELLLEYPSAAPGGALRVMREGQETFKPVLGGISLDAATVVLGQPDLSNPPAAEKSYRRLARLYLASEELLKATDEEQVFDAILSPATQETGAERGFVGLNSEGQETDPYALEIVRFWDPVRKGEAQALEMSETILGQIQRERKAVLVKDVLDRGDFGASVIGLKIRSFICVPITSGERSLGLIYVDTRGSRHEFDRSDLEFVSAIGRMAGLSLENLRIQRKLKRENEKLRSMVSSTTELIGSSESMKAVLRLIDKVAPRDASVLITGENGTGKELVARAIHQGSPRKDKPFVAVNCGAIPSNLVESELFGYEKGAFTGAQQTTEGKFDLANGGTLFLDEIGDMPLDMQVKILRALQERKFYRVGGKKEMTVDIRVISATNQDLKKAIAGNSFREDLYFRLAVVTVVIPPLRDRGNDIAEIAESFLGQGSGVVLTPATRECLLNYSWPGNIRELRNVLEQAVILGDGKRITPADLPPHVRKTAQGKMIFRLKPIAEVEKQYIQRVLEETDGNKARAATILGISRETLYQRLKQHGQDVPEK